jgi:nucleoside-diphosphate-sugar epimerase
MRMDLTVNILTNHAVKNKKIVVFGGDQKRPNIHIDDMVDVYSTALNIDEKKIDGKIFNAGYHNHKVFEIAEIVRNIIDRNIKIVKTETNDNRSYHISSNKIRSEWGFHPKRSISDAVKDIKSAFDCNLIKNSMKNNKYYNIRRMQEISLK